MGRNNRGRPQAFGRRAGPHPVHADVPIIGQSKPAPKYERTKLVPDPPFGHAIIELIAIEETTGGIIVPGSIPGDEANERPTVARVVKTAPEYVLGGVLIKTPVKPGDGVLIRNIMQDGISHAVDMPERHYAILLLNIAAVHPRETLEQQPANDNAEPAAAQESA